MAENDLRMPVLIDEHGDIAIAWGVDGVPASFVIDGAGHIRHAGKGLSTEIGLRLRLWLAWRRRPFCRVAHQITVDWSRAGGLALGYAGARVVGVRAAHRAG